MPSTTRMESVTLSIFGDRLNVVAHGSGGFRGLGVDDLVLRLEGLLDFGEIEGLAIGGGEHVRLRSRRLWPVRSSARRIYRQ